MFGELAALVTALIWAIGGTMLKPLSGRFHPLVLNQIRCLAAASLFAVFLAATGGFTLLAQVPLRAIIAGTAGTFIGIGIGIFRRVIDYGVLRLRNSLF